MADKTTSASSDVQTISIPIDPNLDADTRESLIRQLGPKGGTGVVGNLADVQRAGAAIVKGESSTFADGVEAPPGTTDEGLANAKAVDEAVQAAVDSAAAQSAGDANTGASISGGDYNVKGAK